MVFWDNSRDNSEIFLLQKKVTRIMAGCQRSKFHRELLGSSLLAYALDCCHAARCLQSGSDMIMIMVRNVIEALFTEGYALR